MDDEKKLQNESLDKDGNFVEKAEDSDNDDLTDFLVKVFDLLKKDPQAAIDFMLTTNEDSLTKYENMLSLWTQDSNVTPTREEIKVFATFVNKLSDKKPFEDERSRNIITRANKLKEDFIDWGSKALQTKCWTKAYNLKPMHTDEECVQLLAQHAEKTYGCNKEFVKSLKNNQIKCTCENVYVPLYMLEYCYNVDKSFDTYRAADPNNPFESDYDFVHTSHNYTSDNLRKNTVFYNGYKSLELEKFCGTEDEVLEEINPLLILSYPIYNPKDTCFTQDKAKQSLDRFSKDDYNRHIKKYDKSYFGYEWYAGIGSITDNSKTVFVPIALLRCTYQGKEYVCLVNKHNGCCYWEDYPASTPMKNAAHIFAFTQVLFLIADIAAAIFNAYQLVTKYFIGSDLLDGIIMAVLTIPLNVLFFVGKHKFNLYQMNSQKYLQQFKRNGHRSFICLLIGDLFWLALNVGLSYVVYKMLDWATIVTG